MSTTSYKESLNLPQTGFPMKADLPVREKEILARWNTEGTYAELRKRSAGKPRFVLHDGPPFANGEIHLGHVLNKTLKDFICRYKTLRGFDAPYIPGWDCHGLPIEHQVTKNMKSGDKTPVLIRRESAAYAKKFIDVQREQFKRLGIWGEWNDPYLTMTPAYEADILRNFADLAEKGFVYEDLKPVYWSTGCRTALAEAEVEYENRTDTAVYVKFRVMSPIPALQKTLREKGLGQAPIFVTAWTTTPWTLPANLALAVHEKLTYAALESSGSEGAEILLVHARLASGAPKAELEKKSGRTFTALPEHLSGKDLAGLEYAHPFLDRKGKIWTAPFVSDADGTGVVHIAPGHGNDDYVLGRQNGLPPFSPVDDAGRLTEEAGVPELAGVYVFDANPKVVQILRDRRTLLAEEPYAHSYPHCWRSKTPIVFRSVRQWFIRVEAFRGKALGEIAKVKWIPEWGRNRIEGSVSTRTDWCISRQRSWGVPIPAFYDDQKKSVLDPAAIRKFADLVEKDGSDLWFTEDDSALAKHLGLSGAEGLKKGTDTLDVWIDSGSSWRAVSARRLGADANHPVDMYLEGSDQHRGWFQSSLLIACAVQDKAPFRSVLTHGFVVDGQGKKMSKSVGNVVIPEEVMKKLGADILRLWVASSDYSEDIRVSQDIFDRIADSYRKFRNTVRFMLGNLHGFEPDRDRMPHAELLEPDRWALSRLACLVEEAESAYQACEFHRFYQAMYHFCVKDLSAVYFDLLKDRLYADPVRSVSGRSCRTALYEIADAVIRLLSPILPFTSEESWSFMPAAKGREVSVHHAAWPSKASAWKDAVLEESWFGLLGWRDKILKALEEKREQKEIGNSLEAAVELHLPGGPESDALAARQAILTQVVLVSRLTLLPSDQGVRILVRKASGQKCARCWIWREDVGQSTDHQDLCLRCDAAVKGHDK